MNIFVLKNTFIKIYISHFSINIFITTRGQSYVLETVAVFAWLVSQANTACVVVLNNFFYQHGGSTYVERVYRKSPIKLRFMVIIRSSAADRLYTIYGV